MSVLDALKNLLQQASLANIAAALVIAAVAFLAVHSSQQEDLAKLNQELAKVKAQLEALKDDAKKVQSHCDSGTSSVRTLSNLIQTASEGVRQHSDAVANADRHLKGIEALAATLKADFDKLAKELRDDIKPAITQIQASLTRSTADLNGLTASGTALSEELRRSSEAVANICTTVDEKLRISAQFRDRQVFEQWVRDQHFMSERVAYNIVLVGEWYHLSPGRMGPADGHGDVVKVLHKEDIRRSWQFERV